MGLWIGFAVTVGFLAALLSLPHFREWLRGRARRRKPDEDPAIVDKRADRKTDTTRFVVVTLGIVIAFAGGMRTTARNKTLTTSNEKLTTELAQERAGRLAAQQDLQNKMEGMKDKIVPRRLLSSERDAIVRAVAEVGGLPPFTVQADSGDMEARAYSNDFFAAFGTAGCVLDGSGTLLGLPPQVTGLHITIAPGRTAPPEGALKLKAVIDRAGLPGVVVGFAPAPWVQGESFQLVVAAKPAT